MLLIFFAVLIQAISGRYLQETSTSFLTLEAELANRVVSGIFQSKNYSWSYSNDFANTLTAQLIPNEGILYDECGGNIRAQRNIWPTLTYNVKFLYTGLHNVYVRGRPTFRNAAQYLYIFTSTNTVIIDLNTNDTLWHNLRLSCSGTFTADNTTTTIINITSSPGVYWDKLVFVRSGVTAPLAGEGPPASVDESISTNTFISTINASPSSSSSLQTISYPSPYLGSVLQITNRTIFGVSGYGRIAVTANPTSVQCQNADGSNNVAQVVCCDLATNASFSCLGVVSFAEAITQCASRGARLCTQTQLRGVTTDCPRNLPVWSSTSCVLESFTTSVSSLTTTSFTANITSLISSNWTSPIYLSYNVVYGCSSLTPPANGSVSYSQSIGSLANYSCSSGFQLVGSAFVACLPSGLWNNSAPSCQGIICDSLPGFAEYSITTSNQGRYPSQATYSCIDGFVGADAFRFCQTDGRWLWQNNVTIACQPEGILSQTSWFAGTTTLVRLEMTLSTALGAGATLTIIVPNEYYLNGSAATLAAVGGVNTLPETTTISISNNQIMLTLPSAMTSTNATFELNGIYNPSKTPVNNVWKVITSQGDVIGFRGNTILNDFSFQTENVWVAREVKYIGVKFTPQYNINAGESIKLTLPSAYDFTLIPSTRYYLGTLDLLNVIYLNINTDSEVYASPADNTIEIVVVGQPVMKNMQTSIYFRTSFNDQELIFNPLSTGPTASVLISTPYESFAPFQPLTITELHGLLVSEYVSVSDFNSLFNPAFQGVTSVIRPSVARSLTSYALVFNGYIAISSPGFYSFNVTADDSARLNIGSTWINVTNSSASSTYYLAACRYPFRLEYLQKVDTAILQLTTNLTTNLSSVTFPNTLSYSYTDSLAYGTVLVNRVAGCPAEGCLMDGSRTLYIYGSNLLDTTLVRIGSLACNDIQVYNSSAISCSLPVQYGSHRVWVRTLCGIGLSATALVTYYPAPVLSYMLNSQSVRVSNFTCASNDGGEIIMIVGNYFSRADVSVEVTYGYRTGSSFEFEYGLTCAVQSHNSTHITCQLASGAGRELTFAVRVASLLTSADSTFSISYPAPSFVSQTFIYSGVAQTNVIGVRSQGDVLLFQGANLGASTVTDATRRKVTYGPANNPGLYTCVIDLNTSNYTHIQCATSRGYGGPFVFRLVSPNNIALETVGRVTTSDISVQTFKYPDGIPVIFSATGCPMSGSVMACPTNALVNNLPITLILSGQNFGALSYLTVTVADSECTNPDFSSDGLQLTCQLPPGSGANRAVTILKDGLFSLPQPIITYAPPTITSLSSDGCLVQASAPTVLYNCDRAGGYTIIINGNNFGQDNAVILIGGSLCANPVQFSHTKMQCTLPPGTGTSISVLVVLYGQFSQIGVTVSYEQCPAGQELTAAGECDLCRVGKYSTGTQTCLFCPSGTYTNTTASQDCTRCTPGRYSFTSGASVCFACQPGTYSTVAATTCPSCTAGRYSSSIGSASCDFCTPGFYQANSFATQCDACSPGFIQVSTGRVSCVPCERGSYNPNFNDTQCQSCPPGRMASSIGAASCDVCPPGTWSLANAVSCTPCAAGYYNSTEGASGCDPCPSATYQDQQGQYFCITCPVGRYNVLDGQTTCTQCEAGRFQNDTGQIDCYDCERGYFTGTSGLVACQLCPLGTYQIYEASSTCSVCDDGQYTNFDNPTFCSPCPPGSYAKAPALQCTFCEPARYTGAYKSSECQLCPIGKYATDIGSVGCLNCDKGQVGNENRTGCINCTPGFFQPNTGQALCIACDVGRFSNDTGLSTCYECPLGKVSNRNGTLCEVCALGQYVDPFASVTPCASCQGGKYGDGFQCAPCPPGTKSSTGFCEPCSPGFFANMTVCEPCPQGLFTNLTNSSFCLPCAAGFYPNRPIADSCVPCDKGNYSTGGSGECTGCLIGKYSDVQGASACKVCPLGYAGGGESCSLCKPGRFVTTTGAASCQYCQENRYLVKPLNGTPACESCPRAGVLCSDGLVANARDYYVVLDAVSGSAIVRRCPKGVCLPEGNCSANRKPYEQNLLCGQCLDSYYEWSGNCVFCDGVNVRLVVVFFLLSWLWVLIFHKAAQTTRGDTKIFLYFVQVVLIVFGQEIDSLFQWMVVFNFNLFDVSGQSCVAPLSPEQKVVLDLVIPIICIVQLLLTMIGVAIYYLIRRWSSQIPAPDLWYWGYIRSMVGLILFTYAGLSKAALQIFKCDSIGDQSYMVASPAIDCNSPSYKALFAAAVVILLLAVIFVPVTLLAFLTYNYSKNNFNTEWWGIKYGILTQAYTRRRFWWEFIAITRRTILIAITVIFSERESMHTALTLFNLLFLISHMKFRPFLKKIENTLENISLFLLSLITCILISTGAPPLSDFAKWLLFILVIVPAFSLLTYVLTVRGLHLSGVQNPAVLDKETDDRRRRDIVANAQRLQLFADLAEENEGEAQSPRQDANPGVELVNIVPPDPQPAAAGVAGAGGFFYYQPPGGGHEVEGVSSTDLPTLPNLEEEDPHRS